MKSKTKVALLGVAVSLATVGAFGATTFAWFTHKTQTQLNFSTATIKSSASNVSVTLHPIVQRVDSTLSAIPIESAEESHTGSFNLFDLSSAFGESFVSKNKNGGYDSVSLNMAASKTATFGIAISTMSVRSTQSVSLSLDWASQSEDATMEANVNNYIRGAILECSDSTFATFESAKHAWIGSDNSSYKNYVTYNSSEERYDSATYQSGEFSTKGVSNQAFTYSAAMTKYYRVCFWFEGTTDLEGNHDAVREETVNFTVEITGSDV